MTIRHIVNEGDSLWSLAHRYLGNGNRWNLIFKHHNKEVARTGPQPYHRLFAIDDADLIFVGQTILIPLRRKNMPPGTGDKSKANKIATPIDLKLKYSIGRDTPPIIYTASYGDYSIKAEMCGEIGIEIKTPGQFKHMSNLELAMSKDSIEAKQKLYNTYDPALTAKPEMAFESGRVQIKAPIAANANLGPFDIKVQAVTPTQMSGTLKPPAVEGDLEMGRRKYKYSADIEYKVDVVWHQRPKGGPEPVKETVPVKKRPAEDNPTIKMTKWDHTVAEKGVVVAVVLVFVTTASLALYRIATRGGIQPAPNTPVISPFTHTIDRDDPRA